MMKDATSWPSLTPPITNKFHIDNIFPFSWTKKSSETVALTRVSRGAAARPWTARMIVRERKLPAKKPHALVPRRPMAEMMKTGRLPQTAAAAAVKNVPPPVVSVINPTMLKEIASVDTLNVEAISSKPVVIIGPSETVTPELRARIRRIVIFVARDH